MSYIAPAGTAVGVMQIIRGLAYGLREPTAALQLSGQGRDQSGLAHFWPVSSGRAAMTLILKAMKTCVGDPRRDEVLIPAYTCYSVPAAIARAGLIPRFCDVDPATLGMDIAALQDSDFTRVLAVISSNLYGLPNELETIESLARRNGSFMLDDAAQALGARLRGRPVGAFGDAGLYSFDKGKIITTIQGGAIIARKSPVATAIGHASASLPKHAVLRQITDAAKLIAYAACLPPARYDVVRRLPLLGLGHTNYDTCFPVERLGPMQIGVASKLMGRLAELNAQRQANATRLRESLHDLPGVALPSIPPDAEPVYARFPIRVLHTAARARVIKALDSAGIGASASYPRALVDVPEIAATLRPGPVDMPGARILASQIVTLPTHGYCPPDLGCRIRAILESCLTETRA